MIGSKSERRRFYRRVFKWSWLVTFPLVSAFVFWAVNTAERYADFGLRFDTLTKQSNLHRIGVVEFQHLLRKAELALTPDQAPTGDGLPRIDLYLQEGDEAKLNENLPESGFDYVTGGLAYPDGDVHEVSLRYRGDFYWHWALHKKSFRVKTKKKSMWNGMRKFNVIAPKGGQVVAGALGYWLSAEMGLLTPRAEMVELYVNGQNRGVHLLLEQLEELVLRNNARMPGDIFAGELLGKDWYRGVSMHVFRHPGLWDKVAINNHFDDGARDSLDELCDLVNGPRTEARVQRLRELVDLEAFGRFAAYRVITQTIHFSDTHNWRLYYDPWKNRFEPIVWDPTAWNPSWTPGPAEAAFTDIINSAIDDALSHDAQYLHAQHAALADFFESGLHGRLLAEVDRVREAVRGPLHNDPALVNAFYRQSPEEALGEIDRLRETIVRITDQLSAIYAPGPRELRYHAHDTSANGVARISLEVDGRAPIERFAIDLLEPPRERPQVLLAYRRGAERVEVNVSGAVAMRGNELVVDHPLVAGFARRLSPGSKTNNGVLRSRPAVYEVVLRGLSPDGNEVTDLRVGQPNGEWWPVRDAGAPIPLVPFDELRGVGVPRPLQDPLVLEGVVELEGFRTITRPVVIRPGTVLQMRPGASLILESTLIASGTSDLPIRIEPHPSARDPWGVLALRGHGCDGSKLEHVRMVGGSGSKEPLAEYSAMLSIHDVPHVSIRACEFRRSKVVDDMVHAVYSDVSFQDCTFVESLFDALDLDVCTGEVRNCRFLRSGNAALDLMASQIVVRDCQLIGSVDKGVSVGEGTTALVMNTRLRECLIGVQVKDGSRATVVNCEFDENDQALHAYKKNWRYDSGGFAFVYESLISGEGDALYADKHSRIYVHDSWIEREEDFSKRIVLTDSVDVGEPSEGRRRRRSRDGFRFDLERDSQPTSFVEYMSEIHMPYRGAVN